MLFLALDTKNSYVGYVTFLLGALSLSGLIFSGMIAKEVIFTSLILAKTIGSIRSNPIYDHHSVF